MSALVRQMQRQQVQATIVLLLGAVLAFAPDHFLGVLARAFLKQWAVLFVVLVMIAAGLRRWLLAGSSALSAMLVAFPVVPHGQVAVESMAGEAAVRVAQINLLQPNREHGAVINAARMTGADVLSFQEVNVRWANVLLDGLNDAYPYHRIVPQEDCYGIALFSKLPFDRMETVRLTAHPVINATVRTPNGLVRIVAVHATSPGSYAEFRDRQEQLHRLAALIGNNAQPTVLVGDLNTVTWDHAFSVLCAKTGTHEGPQASCATWPSFCGFALIPLDHVLATSGLAPSVPRTFLIPGSDHRGLAVDIHIPSRP